MPEIKQIHFKDADISDAGAVKAVFATLGVVDHDGDIILPGSIPNGHQVRMSAYNHSSWQHALPVGKGTISEVGNELIFDGQFFLDTTDGADTYKTVKGLGDLTEWSFGFDILQKESGIDPATNREVRMLKRLNVTEVSPVLLGAGINTRTVGIKGTGAEPKTYQEHAKDVLDSVTDFVKRTQSIADLRTEKGKEPVSEKNRDELKELSRELQKAMDELNHLIDSSVETKAEIDGAILDYFSNQQTIREALYGI